ncbi:helix-turn-helix domain-containing protein [Stenotrophomonas sp. NPDC087984]
MSASLTGNSLYTALPHRDARHVFMSTGGESAQTRPCAPGPLVSMSTDGVPPQDRLEWWRHMMESDVISTTLRSDQANRFRGRVRAVDLPDTRVAAFTFSPLSARREPVHIRRHDPESYFLFLVQGSPVRLEQSRTISCLTSGCMAVFDTSHPLVADFPSQNGRRQRITLMQLPRTSLPLPSDKIDQLLSRPLDTRSPAGVLLGHLLSSFLDSVTHGSPAEVHRMGTIGVDLAAAFFAGLLKVGDSLPVETREHVLLVRINAFIDHNLGDPELRPATVAAHHHISVRTLHLLFRTQPETVSATIRRRRLERCRTDLTDPRLRHRTIGEIAIRWGFRHPADFSRAFRAAYGTAPSDLRHSVLRQSPGKPVSGTFRRHNWVPPPSTASSAPVV